MSWTLDRTLTFVRPSGGPIALCLRPARAENMAHLRCSSESRCSITVNLLRPCCHRNLHSRLDLPRFCSLLAAPLAWGRHSFVQPLLVRHSGSRAWHTRTGERLSLLRLCFLRASCVVMPQLARQSPFLCQRLLRPESLASHGLSGRRDRVGSTASSRPGIPGTWRPRVWLRSSKHRPRRPVPHLLFGPLAWALLGAVAPSRALLGPGRYRHARFLSADGPMNTLGRCQA